MKRIVPVAAVLVAAALHSGCGGVTCGVGTEQRVDPNGNTTCVAPAAAGVQCGDNAMVVGGVCVGLDPSKVCGQGTMFDPASKTCIPMGGGQTLPPPCPQQDATHFCVNGVVHFLKNGMYTAGTTLEVRAYEPLSFLSGGTTPLAPSPVMTDAKGTYIISGLKFSDVAGMKIVAVAVTDPGGPTNYALAGAALDKIAGGQSYRIDLYAVEKSTVATWDTQAGLSGGGTFEKNGAYVARFRNAADLPVAGVQLTFNGSVVPSSEAFYFKSGTAEDLTTIDKTQTMTDASTGAVVDRVAAGNLGNYSGMGGGNWGMAILGTSTTGVVFVQTFKSM